MTVIELVVSLAAILGAAVLFVNAVEMMGERLNLGQGAVGSVLAAVGTALPETMIPIVALIGAALLGTGSGSAGEIGIGAILGAPFLLSTLAMAVIAASAIGFGRRRSSGREVVVDRQTAIRDMAFFVVFFGLAAAAGVVPLPTWLRIILAVLLVAAYAFHVYMTIKTGGGSDEDAPENLTLWPFRSEAPTWAVAAQLLGSIAIMAVGAYFFVTVVEEISRAVGIPAGLIALVLAPLATELPEKFNSVIWLRDNKDTLALGNITGAMVFQSTIPVALGVLLTRWQLGFLTAFAAVIAFVSGIAILLLLLRKRPVRAEVLLGGGVLYAVFLAVAFVYVFVA